MKISIGLLHTGLRGDEKLIINSADKMGVKVTPINVSELLFGAGDVSWSKHNVYLERCISTIKGFHAVHYLTQYGHTVVNPPSIATICDSKFSTSNLMEVHGVPTPRSYLAFNEKTAKEAVKLLGGYPVVIKSDSGSWGRLISIVHDEMSLESIVEHKHVLGSVHQKAIYVQDYIQKPGRDIRCFVFASEVKAAIYRTSNHWITNTARGAHASNCQITKEISFICRQASNAIAHETGTDGGVLAIDLLEDKKRGLLVNEINHTMEFKNSEKPTGVSISEEIINYCISVAKRTYDN